jgi:hypothetical protein
MPGHPPGLFEATEMPTAGWWEALWPAPHEIVTAVGILPDMEVVDLSELQRRSRVGQCLWSPVSHAVLYPRNIRRHHGAVECARILIAHASHRRCGIPVKMLVIRIVIHFVRRL